MSHRKTVLLYVDPKFKGCASDPLSKVLNRLARSIGLNLAFSSQNSDGMIQVLKARSRDNSSNFREELDQRQYLSPSVLKILITEGDGKKSVIRFAEHELVPDPFKGRRIECNDPGPVVTDLPKGDILATINDSPSWIVNRDGQRRTDVVFCPNPWVTQDSRIFEHLKGPVMFRLIPIIEWMKHVRGFSDWQEPPLRANIMFDDINCHHITYGYINFNVLAHLVNELGCAVSFASVPLDLWFAARKAIDSVQLANGRLSFLVHGIFHSAKELGSDSLVTPSTIEWALEKIATYERKYKLGLERIVAPPYGSISLTNMAIFSAAGFEAVCVSWGSIWSSNRHWLEGDGLGNEPGVILNGLGIIPRFRLSFDMMNHLLLCGYLNQPAIAVGHHWDLKDGLDLLTETVKFLGSLGHVHWCSPGSISRTSYAWKVQGKKLVVKPMSRVVEVPFPEGEEIEVVEVDMSRAVWSPDFCGSYEMWAWNSRGERLTCINAEKDLWVVETSRQPWIRIELKIPFLRVAQRKGGCLFVTKHMVKRLATEARDRLMPLFSAGRR